MTRLMGTELVGAPRQDEGGQPWGVRMGCPSQPSLRPHGETGSTGMSHGTGMWHPKGSWKHSWMPAHTVSELHLLRGGWLGVSPSECVSWLLITLLLPARGQLMYPKPSWRAAQRGWGESHGVPGVPPAVPPDRGHTGDRRAFSWWRSSSPEPWRRRRSQCLGLALQNASAMWGLFWEEFGAV